LRSNTKDYGGKTH